MPTAREQVEAYSHEVRRQALALLDGDEPVTVDPRKRLNRSFIGGMVVAVLAVAVAGVVGLLAGSGQTSLPDSGTVLVSGTGDRYVVVDKVLHPALNLASAVLLGGSKVTTVAPSALEGAQRGLPVGIPGAPDALPTATNLITATWDVCSVASQAQDARDQVSVAIGGDSAPPAGTLTDSEAVVVTTGRGNQLSTWLLVDGQRLQVNNAALGLLGLERIAPTPVDAQILNLLPAGPALTVPRVSNAGQPPSVALPFDAVVGDLVTLQGNNTPAYVVLTNGLAPVDPFAARLLSGAATKTVTVSADVITRLPAGLRPPVPTGWPQQLPQLRAVAGGKPLCVHYVPGANPTIASAAWAVTVSAPATVGLPSGLSSVSPASGPLPTLATVLAVRSGKGVLARQTTTGGGDGSFVLLLDSGLQFPVASADAVARLGYDPSRAVPVPSPYLALIPRGPSLSPAAAAAEYGGGAVGVSPTPSPVGSVSVPAGS